MNSPVLDSIKKHTPKFLKKMKWWLILGFVFFGFMSLGSSEGDYVIFLYTFLPYLLGFLIVLIVVYYLKFRKEK